MKTNTAWTILFCQTCGEPTPPNAGMKTPFGFLCDYCMNTNSLPSPRLLENPANH